MTADEMQPLKPTRASFIRSLPLSVPFEEVIERGREVGITIQPSDVHSTRYYMRQEESARSSAVSPDTARVIRPLAFQSAEVRAVPTQDMRPEESTHAREPSRLRKSRRQKAHAREQGPSLAAVEQDLRAIVLRLGSDRIRAMIEEIEASTLRVVLDARRPTRSR